MIGGDHGRPVIFAGWAGADPDKTATLMEEGKLPVLAEISKRGASGCLAGYAPFSCPMQWTTMATGWLPPRHGVHGWRTARGGENRLSGPADRGAPAFWNLMADHGVSCGVVDWPVSVPEPPRENLTVVSTEGKEKLPGDLEEMRVKVGDLDPGLLGLFIPRIGDVAADDPRVGTVMDLLARLYTAHNVSVRLLEGVRCLAVRYDFIGKVTDCFGAMRNDRDEEIFGGVVEAAYRVQDILLGDLWNAAGGMKEARMMVGSDLAPVGWFAIGGPGVVSGARVARGRLEDVAPTLLAMAGLPALRSMNGRVLAETLESIPPVRVSDDGEVPAAEDIKEGCETGKANDWNLGVALLALNKPAEALAPLERCYFAEPESAACAGEVARCRARLGMFVEAKRALATLEDGEMNAGRALLLAAEIALAERRSDVALEKLEAAAILTGAMIVERQRLRWQALLLESQYLKVAEEISSVLPERETEEIDLILLSHARLCLGDFRGAAEIAEGAMKLGGRSTAPYNLLGQSLERMGEFAEALRIYSEWLVLEPGQEFASQRVVALAKNPPRPLPDKFEPTLMSAKAEEWSRVRAQSLEESAQRLAAIATPDGTDAVQVRNADEREKGRVARHFGIAGAPDGFREIGMWVTVVGPERRIVAVYQLVRECGGSEDDGATVRHSVLSRWRKHPSAVEALLKIERQARADGLRRLRVQLDPESEELALWELSGFERCETREVWSFGTESRLREVTERMLEGVEDRVEPLRTEDLEAVATLCSRLALLPAGRVSEVGSFDPRISFLVRDGEQVLGVLLARVMGDGAYIEVFAKHPDAGRPLTRVTPMLLLRFRNACAELGIGMVRCIIRPDLTPGLRRLMTRSGGGLVSRFARFEKDLAGDL